MWYSVVWCNVRERFARSLARLAEGWAARLGAVRCSSRRLAVYSQPGPRIQDRYRVGSGGAAAAAVASLPK